EVGQAGACEAGVRVDPEKRAAAAEVAVRARRVAAPGPVWLLRVAELEAEAPVVRVHPAELGQHTDEPGEGDARRLGQRLGRYQPRRRDLARERNEVLESPVERVGRRAAQLGAHRERLEDRSAEV